MLDFLLKFHASQDLSILILSDNQLFIIHNISLGLNELQSRDFM